MSTRHLLASGCALMAGVFSVQCFAADASTGTESSDRSARDVLQEVVVTAQRRNESMQTTAISATVLTGEMLADKGIVNLTSVQQAAPGIIIADYGSANTFNIRGIGQARVDIDLPSGVAIYRDGVPTLTGYFQNAPYYDMASLEVLRGPQGTFGGKSAAAGALFLHTRDPVLSETSADLMAGFGNYSYLETTGVFNMPIGSTAAIRASIHMESRASLYDSIRSNPLPGGAGAGGDFHGDDNRKIHSGRIGVLWRPNDAFEAILKVDLDKLYFGAHISSGLDPVTGVAQDIRNPIVNGPHYYEDHGYRTSLNLHYKLPNGVTIGSLTGYSYVFTHADWDINGADPRPFSLASKGTFKNASEEINFVSPKDGKINWVAGVFLQRYENDIPADGFGFLTNNTTSPSYVTPWKKNENTYAAFGQVGFVFSPELELQVGARWGHYDFDQFTHFVIDFSALGGGPNTSFFDLEPPDGTKQHYKENSTDWKINLNYQPSPEHFLYASIARGHSPGSINLASPSFFADRDHGTYQPMKVTNFEVGWKASFLDRHLQSQLSLYYQKFKNYQADFSLAATPGLPSNTTLFQFQNALTDSKIYGAELGVQANVANFSFDLGFSYNHSKLGSFGEVVNTFAGVPGFDPRPSVNLDGASTPFSPKVTTALGIAYHGNLSNGWTVTPRIDLSYRTDAYSRLWQNAATRLPGYTLLNANIRFAKDRKFFEIWGTNLTDKAYIGAKQNVDGAGPDAQYPYAHITGIVYAGLPRLFGVRAGTSF